MTDGFVFTEKLFKGFDIFGFKGIRIIFLEWFKDFGNPVGDVAVGLFHFIGKVKVKDQTVDD